MGLFGGIFYLKPTLKLWIITNCKKWILQPLSRKNNLRPQKGRFTPDLPNVQRYGGISPTVLTTQYPEIRQPDPDPFGKSLPYTATTHYFSPLETALFHALERALHQQPYRIFGKVPLTHLLTTLPNLDSHTQQSAYERLQQKQLDFVICHADTLEVKGVVLVESRPHSPAGDLQKRFLEAALATAHIPLLKVPPRQDYPLIPLQKLLKQVLGIHLKLTSVQVCPRCGAPLKSATVSKGAAQGQRVWVCSHYPQCKTVQAMLGSEES